jgi:hypothetical protein
MMQPPTEFDNLVSSVQTLKILLITFISAMLALLLVVMLQLRSVGNKLSHLVNLLLTPPVIGMTRKAFDTLQQEAAQQKPEGPK